MLSEYGNSLSLPSLYSPPLLSLPVPFPYLPFPYESRPLNPATESGRTLYVPPNGPGGVWPMNAFWCNLYAKKTVPQMTTCLTV